MRLARSRNIAILFAGVAGATTCAFGVDPPASFEDATALLGDYERPGVDPVPFNQGGAAWADFDNDGRLDLFLVNDGG
ncbi:MAG: hypothetical protein ACYTGG_13515, partial [Planctomycetota bacterium]